MNPDIPEHYQTSFKKYLPSKKIWIALCVIAIIVAAYFAVPWAWAKSRRGRTPAPAVPLVTDVPIAPTGDPITRDTLNDGIPDWEKIAVGLNPGDPNSTAEFQKIQSTEAPAAMAQIENSTDTDKVSYTIFNNILNAANQTGALSDSVVTDQTNQELANYVQSLTPPEIYSDTSVQTVPDTSENQAAYKNQLNTIESMDLFSKTFQADLSSYLTTGTEAKTVLAMANQVQAALLEIQPIPIPAGIVDYQVGTMNALDGFSKVLLAYDPTNTDPLYQFANLTLVQTYEYAIIKNSAAILDYYQDPEGPELDKIIAANETASSIPTASSTTP